MEHHDPSASDAEELFVQWLRRREQGRAEDLDELCRAHAQLAPELMAMASGWLRLEPLLAQPAEVPEAAADPQAVEQAVERLTLRRGTAETGRPWRRTSASSARGTSRP